MSLRVADEEMRESVWAEVTQRGKRLLGKVSPL